MKNLKFIIPMLIGVLMLIGGLTLFNSSKVEAQSEGPNCYLNPIDKDCYDLRVVDCLCGEKGGSDVEG